MSQLALQKQPEPTQDQNQQHGDPQHQDPQARAASSSGLNHHPGGKDPLGQKENLLAPFYEDMKQVAAQLVPLFTPLGLHFRPEILLATAMQEASSVDPANARSFDNGLGIMQITPYQGRLDAKVAQAIGWDNSKGIEYNVQHSRWRDAKANLLAGGYTMLGKAQSIKGGVSHVWAEMDEAHRWRAVLFAYNAGEGSAIRALRQGGPNAPMISTFVYKGKTISHDYTKEIQSKIEYVDGHDPFSGGGGGAQQQSQSAGPTTHATAPPSQDVQKPAHHEHHHKGSHPILDSVGKGGVNHKRDVIAVQKQLHERGVDPGAIDGAMGPHTLRAIEEFQSTFMPHPDGLIEPGKGTEHHLFAGHGVVHPKQPAAPTHAAPHAAPQHHEQGGPQHVDEHSKTVSGDGLPRIDSGVKLTPAIVANYRVLVPYLPSSVHLTSGLRTDQDQANLIHRYYAQHGGHGLTDAEQQREWLHDNFGMIIARVGSSPHRTGLAFDLSGAPLSEINAAVYRCKREKPSEFHLKDTIVERANNCLHVDVTQ